MPIEDKDRCTTTSGPYRCELRKGHSGQCEASTGRAWLGPAPPLGKGVREVRAPSWVGPRPETKT